VQKLSALGHNVEEVELPLNGWNEVFGPLVLAEEGRLRGHLLQTHRESLTDYERSTLEAAAALDPKTVELMGRQHAVFTRRVDDFFDIFDLIVTPTTAVTSFPVGKRPQSIDGERVDSLWGAFPFTAAFNVAGTPAASLPCGLAGGLPVGLQLVCRCGRDAQLLDISEDLEEVVGFDARALIDRYSDLRQAAATT
jgi:Asp-tRNA(Asn)/Glu-tRNA(Gln) amidotransferase A subunit family amidase